MKVSGTVLVSGIGELRPNFIPESTRDLRFVDHVLDDSSKAHIRHGLLRLICFSVHLGVEVLALGSNESDDVGDRDANGILARDSQRGQLWNLRHKVIQGQALSNK